MKVEDELMPRRSDSRRFAALILITVATAFAIGHTLRQPAFMTANDISRWCTVWSLLERGTYAIDECPWQTDTQDKVERAPKGSGENPAPKHFYSSKPALISTLIAGILYPARRLTGVPLDRVVLQERAERWTQKPDPDHPGKFKGVLETPKDPVKWPAYIFYFKPTLILMNAIPFGIYLILFARVLDRYAANEWTWLFCLMAAAFGTYLLPYTQTLNNHTIGAFSAFFALYHVLRIWDDGELSGWRFASAGFFAGFTASTELPALAFPAVLGPLLLLRYPGQTLRYFLPAAIVPLAAFVAAQYVEFGEFYLPYESFGSEEYSYEGSFWLMPLELDAFNKYPEPKWVYLFHMTFGHHGIFSLTPIFLFSVWGALRLLLGRGRSGTAWRDPMASVAGMTVVLTVVVLAFYTWTPKARNYGGSAQGLRWVMWLIPFWLLLLIKGVEGGQTRGWVRNLALLALAISALSVGYATRNPWSHPWILDAMEHLNLYPLTR